MPDGNGSARLYRLDTDGTLTKLLDRIGLSNGMGFTPDRSRMYYTDSYARKIYLFDYDLETRRYHEPEGLRRHGGRGDPRRDDRGRRRLRLVGQSGRIDPGPLHARGRRGPVGGFSRQDGLELRLACEELLDLLLNHDGHEETLGALKAALQRVDSGTGAPSAEQMETFGQGWIAEEALAMGVYAALAADDVRSALLLAVNHSGDSDSTGATAGSLLGAMHGVEALSGDLIGDVELRPLIVTIAGDLSMSSRVTKRA